MKLRQGCLYVWTKMLHPDPRIWLKNGNKKCFTPQWTSSIEDVFTFQEFIRVESTLSKIAGKKVATSLLPKVGNVTAKTKRRYTLLLLASSQGATLRSDNASNIPWAVTNKSDNCSNIPKAITLRSDNATNFRVAITVLSDNGYGTVPMWLKQ